MVHGGGHRWSTLAPIPDHAREANMRVLAAAFENAAAARTVLEELRRRFDLPSTDVGIAPLGTDDRSGNRTVLAGRFREGNVDAIRAMVTAHGGLVVSEVDERWTRSSSSHEAMEAEPDHPEGARL